MCQRFFSPFLAAGSPRIGVRPRPAGFTLIELMIVVAIIAIIASIAYPAYQNSVLQGRRAQGKSAILSSLQAEERYYSLNNTYVAYPPMTGLPSTFMQTSASDGVSPGSYTLVAAACGASPLTQCVRITATPVVADAVCGTLIADSTGAETTSPPTANPTCWP